MTANRVGRRLHFLLAKTTPNFVGHSHVRETPNIMGLPYVLSFMGFSYVLVTHNVMELSKFMYSDPLSIMELSY